MLENVLKPLQKQLPTTTYQLILLYYIQSLLHSQITVESDM